MMQSSGLAKPKAKIAFLGLSLAANTMGANLKKHPNKEEREENIRTAISLAPLYKGNVQKIADHIGLTAGAIHRYIRQSKALSDCVEEARHTYRLRAVDNAEEVVFDAVDNGDIKASKFVLSTLGKDRGYTTRTEIKSDRNAALDEVSTSTLFEWAKDLMQGKGEGSGIGLNAVDAEWSNLTEQEVKALQEM
jgi:hypothetical protein